MLSCYAILNMDLLRGKCVRYSSLFFSDDPLQSHYCLAHQRTLEDRMTRLENSRSNSQEQIAVSSNSPIPALEKPVLNRSRRFGQIHFHSDDPPRLNRAMRLIVALLLIITFAQFMHEAPLQASAATVTFVGAGDISTCSNNNDEATAKLLDGISGTVFTTGDHVYPDGTSTQFTNCYKPTWGRHKGRTRPTPGNHDYNTSGA